MPVRELVNGRFPDEPGAPGLYKTAKGLVLVTSDAAIYPHRPMGKNREDEVGGTGRTCITHVTNLSSL